MKIDILQNSDLEKKINSLDSSLNVGTRNYLAMYSSWFNGITKDAKWMMLPIDDHIVHRGDGVFEYIKATDRKLFLLEAHLERLKSSAERIGLKLPNTIEEIKEIILQTLKAADQDHVGVRLYVSRGPGSFTQNPYESIASQLYIVITAFKPLSDTKYDQGVKIGRSQIPIKETWLAQVKSCNYLNNVLMKKEAVDRSLDFTIGYDSDGFIGESSTENIVIVDKNGVLCHPRLDHILRGTTMTRVFELVKKNKLMKTSVRDISEHDLLDAQEAMMVGTTLDCLPVATYEGKKVGTGDFKFSRQFNQLLKGDLLESQNTF